MTDQPVEVSTTIDADAESVWRMVSDLPRMGEWSPENTGGRWRGDSGPRVGAKFIGTNKHSWRRWATQVTVTECEPGKSFVFNVDFAGVPISTWIYRFEPVDGGTRVTERWEDRRPRWMVSAGKVAMGVPDRSAHNRSTMERTLAGLKAAAERG